MPHFGIQTFLLTPQRFRSLIGALLFSMSPGIFQILFWLSCSCLYIDRSRFCGGGSTRQAFLNCSSTADQAFLNCSSTADQAFLNCSSTALQAFLFLFQDVLEKDNAEATDIMECLIKHKNKADMDRKCFAGIEHHQLVSLVARNRKSHLLNNMNVKSFTRTLISILLI